MHFQCVCEVYIMDIRGGSRAGGLGGAPQITRRHTNTNPIHTRTNARVHAHTRMHNCYQHLGLCLTCIVGQFHKNDSIIPTKLFHSGHNQFTALFCIGEKRGFISLSRSVMNGIVNVMWKYCCGVAARVLARYSCRHSLNLRLQSLTIINTGIPLMP